MNFQSFKENSSVRYLLQKKVTVALITLVVVIFVALLFFIFTGNSEKASSSQHIKRPAEVNVVSSGVNQDNLRIAELEKRDDLQANELEYMKSKLQELSEEKHLIHQQLDRMQGKITEARSENENLKTSLNYYENQQHERDLLKQAQADAQIFEESNMYESDFFCWGTDETDFNNEKSIKYEIPPGTLVKGVIIQGVSQPVGVGKPADPEVALVRITSAGKLPKKLRMALKGSNLLCSTESVLSNRRVRVRGETMSKHKKNGSFIVTEVAAVISGPGGKAGVPASLVSYGGVQAGYSAIASTMGAAASTLQTILNNQTISKLSEIGPDQAILNSDVFTNIGLNGVNGGFDKITDYYLKMADLYCPVLEIDMGTEVSILFTTTVTLGEKNLKNRLDRERAGQNEIFNP